MHTIISGIPGDSVNQGLSGVPVFTDISVCWFAFPSLNSAVAQVQAAPSGVEEGPDPQLVDAELQRAREGTENMKLLRGHVTFVASTASNTSADLAATNDFETTYLQPPKIIDAVFEKITDVWAIAASTSL